MWWKKQKAERQASVPGLNESFRYPCEGYARVSEVLITEDRICWGDREDPIGDLRGERLYAVWRSREASSEEVAFEKAG